MYLGSLVPKTVKFSYGLPIDIVFLLFFYLIKSVFDKKLKGKIQNPTKREKKFVFFWWLLWVKKFKNNVTFHRVIYIHIHYLSMQYKEKEYSRRVDTYIYCFQLAFLFFFFIEMKQILFRFCLFLC